MATKADKLISRGSETPEVAAAAERIAEMLIRMTLNQPQYFAETVERALPGLTQDEAARLTDFFHAVARYFSLKAAGDELPQLERLYTNQPAVRGWEMGDGLYNILRVLAVLACPFDYCPDKPDCWETRRAFCKMEGKTQP